MVSVSDEILALEPLKDKVTVLREKYEMTTFELLETIKSRLNFLSVYSLYDVVTCNHMDLQK